MCLIKSIDFDIDIVYLLTGWDQSDKFIKFYVTLAKVHKLPAENVVCKWSNKSLELEVKGLENKDYILTIKNLLYNIDPAKSSWKVKTGTYIINKYYSIPPMFL